MSSGAALRRTPLTHLHEAAGARLVDFAGYLMPVQYEGILDEVRRVRTRVGLFDLCHMGRCRIVGAGRIAAAQSLVHVDVEGQPLGAIRYSFFAREDGTTIDDVLIYRDAEEIYFCINAGNHERDLAWMRAAAARSRARVEDLSDAQAMVAIQGPASADVLAPLAGGDVRGLKYYHFLRGTVCDVPALVSRTGYTGEDGYELCFEASAAPRVWEALRESGRAHGIAPIGLAARDVLRLEAGMALYGHELDDTTNPVEAGIVRSLKHERPFSGRAAIERMLAEGPARVLVGFKTDAPRVPRQGYALVTTEHEHVGTVCSGAPSPTVGSHIGTAYVLAGHAAPGTPLAFEIRGQRFPVTLTALPFYRRAR